MLKRILKACWLLALVLTLLVVNTRAQFFISLSEQNRIQLILDHLKKATQKTDSLQIFLILGNQISVKGEITDPRPQVRLIFDQAESRKTVISPPPKAENRKFWDLEITNLVINFTEDSTEAVGNCKLKLWAAKTDIPRTVKQISESFKFKKVGKGWKLVGFDNLLDFLGREVSSSEKD